MRNKREIVRSKCIYCHNPIHKMKSGMWVHNINLPFEACNQTALPVKEEE